jgi:hypothetical protein
MSPDEVPQELVDLFYASYFALDEKFVEHGTYIRRQLAAVLTRDRALEQQRILVLLRSHANSVEITVPPPGHDPAEYVLGVRHAIDLIVHGDQPMEAPRDG